jgi:hypothetical protein
VHLRGEERKRLGAGARGTRVQLSGRFQNRASVARGAAASGNGSGVKELAGPLDELLSHPACPAG